MQQGNLPSLTELYTGGGRFVQGDLMRKGDKGYNNAPIAPEDQEYYLGVAVPKTDPNIGNLIDQLYQMASTHYAQYPVISQQIALGLNGKFSWKIEDGDVAKADPQTGQLKEIPEYLKGCWLLKFHTKYEFSACDMINNVLHPIDRSQIKRGDFVEIKFTAQPNGRVDHNAGLKLYPQAIMRIGIGDAISGAIAATDAFAGRVGVTQAMGAPVGSQPGGVMQGGMAPQQQQPPMQQQPMQGGMVPQQQPMGNGMNPAPTQNVPGGMPAGAPAGAPGQQTVSPSDPAAMGVVPHTGILQGPQGGMAPQQQQQQQQPVAGGMPMG